MILAACNGGSNPMPPVSAVWAFQYSPGMPPSMVGNYFDFPPQDGVHYVVRSGAARSSIGMTFTISGNGTIVPTQGNPPALVRLYFQRAGDDMSGAGQYEFYRWWSTDSIELKAGDFTLAVPLTPERWSSVYGKHGDVVPAQFQAAVGGMQTLGFTFGGEFAGHGDYVTNGSARFTLTSFTAQ